MFPRPLLIGVSIFASILILAGAYGTYTFGTRLASVRTDFASSTAAYSTQVAELMDALHTSRNESATLATMLAQEQRKNGTFQDQIQSIAGTVGTLEKLAQTDPELLAKYSKIYFLNENYTPPALVDLPKEYLVIPDRTLSVHAEVEPFLVNLFEAATDDDIDMVAASAYRSFGTQAALKSSYKVTYGTGANAFSADQGYSEHQLGTTIDFTTSNGSLAGFETTPAYAWLTKHAWRYGFILSYPKGNGFYQYEPWHWRFVGRALARHLHEEELNFYDLDQRVIDTYLVSLFD